MKKLNAKGFTLIELLAVITIMGVLMIVAIPTVGRTIENTRRDTFLDTAKQYVNGAKTMWLSDSLVCGTDYANAVPASAVPADGPNGKDYYILIDTTKTGTAIGPSTQYPILLESGGKSSWGNAHLKGYIKINVKMNASGAQQVKYSIKLTDNTRGITNDTLSYLELKRSHVYTTGATYPATTVSGATKCYEM